MDKTIIIIISIIVFSIAGIFLCMSIRQFLQKGKLFNNEYLHSTKKQRAKMSDEYKKPYYVQSSIIFFILFLIFLTTGINIIFHHILLTILTYGLIVAMILYTIISYIKIKK